MKVKVCGITNEDNARALLPARPDYLGLIFVPRSPRYFRTSFTASFHQELAAANVRLCGVFMDTEPDAICAAIAQHGLSSVQLHGQESPGLCLRLKASNSSLEVWKSLPVGALLPQELERYDDGVDFFLFDTATAFGGGSGKKFDWNLLDGYRSKKSFFLSGGIAREDAPYIREFARAHPQLLGVDINSRFETEPGIKDSVLVSRFISEVRHVV